MSILNNELKPPESRGEKTLHDMIGRDYPLEPSQSRVESLLIALKNAIEQGPGGSGLPDVTPNDNEKILIVENGKWVLKTADRDFAANSGRPIASDIVSARLSAMQSQIDMCIPVTRACDSTAQFALGQITGGQVELVVPVDVDDTDKLLALVSTGYLLWTNGTKLDSGKVLIEIDMTNSAITLYARGKSSMVSGVMGVDTSWTVTSL